MDYYITGGYWKQFIGKIPRLETNFLKSFMIFLTFSNIFDHFEDIFRVIIFDHFEDIFMYFLQLITFLKKLRS